MDPKTITLALELAALAARLVIDIKKQSGLSDEELLALADAKDDETAARIKVFLEGLK
jgi:hypothetical protein